MGRRRKSPVQVETTEPHMCSIDVRLRILSGLPFFQSLSPGELEKVNTYFQEKGFEPGDFVYLSGDPGGHFFVIAEGRVKLIRHAASGRDVMVDFLVPGEYFGALTLQADKPYPETAQAQTPVCALVIPTNRFRSLIQTYPLVAVQVLDATSARLLTAHETIHQLSAQSAERRIAYMLMKLAEKIGEQSDVGLLIQTPLSRDDLAEMTATTPETASRVISQFQKDGLIATGRQWIAITDQATLQQIIEEE